MHARPNSRLYEKFLTTNLLFGIYDAFGDVQPYDYVSFSSEKLLIIDIDWKMKRLMFTMVVGVRGVSALFSFYVDERVNDMWVL